MSKIINKTKYKIVDLSNKNQIPILEKERFPSLEKALERVDLLSRTYNNKTTPLKHDFEVIEVKQKILKDQSLIVRFFNQFLVETKINISASIFTLVGFIGLFLSLFYNFFNNVNYLWLSLLIIGLVWLFVGAFITYPIRNDELINETIIKESINE